MSTCINESVLTRKILRIGPRSYAIVLPKKWIQELGLTVGATLIVKQCDYMIIIKPAEYSFKKAEGIAVLSSQKVRKLLKLGLSINDIITSSFIVGFDKIELPPEAVDVKNISLIKSTFPWIEMENSTLSFTVKEAIYDETVILKDMLNTITTIIDITLDVLYNKVFGNEDLSTYLNFFQSRLQRYGFLLARKLVILGKEKDNITLLTSLLAGFILGLLGELLLVTLISLQRKPLKYNEANVFSTLLEDLRFIVWESINGLIYKSLRRLKVAKTALRKVKMKIKALRYYSLINEDLADYVSRIDTMTRLLNKIIETYQCMLLISSNPNE